MEENAKMAVEWLKESNISLQKMRKLLQTTAERNQMQIKKKQNTAGMNKNNNSPDLISVLLLNDSYVELSISSKTLLSPVHGQGAGA